MPWTSNSCFTTPSGGITRAINGADVKRFEDDSSARPVILVVVEDTVRPDPGDTTVTRGLAPPTS